MYWSLYQFSFPPPLSKLLKNQFSLKKGNKTGLKHSDSHSDAKPQYKSKVLDETELVAHVREGE